jgi:hypothetical protein
VPCLSRCGVRLALGQGGFSLPQPHSPPSNSGLITEKGLKGRGDKKPRFFRSRTLCPPLSSVRRTPALLLRLTVFPTVMDPGLRMICHRRHRWKTRDDQVATRCKQWCGHTQEGRSAYDLTCAI